MSGAKKTIRVKTYSDNRIGCWDNRKCQLPNDFGLSVQEQPMCQAPCDYIPKMSYPLLQAREVLRLLAEEGIEGSGKEVEPRGDGV